jgi:predicted phage tail protein
VITVTARDSAGNTAQKKLTISYTAVSTNTATLSWNAPTTGTNLSGYRVYYGTSPGTYQQSSGQGISVGNITSYTVIGLSHGTRYYFAVTAFDTSGNESTFSNEAFKDIP